MGPYRTTRDVETVHPAVLARGPFPELFHYSYITEAKSPHFIKSRGCGRMDKASQLQLVCSCGDCSVRVLPAPKFFCLFTHSSGQAGLSF